MADADDFPLADEEYYIDDDDDDGIASLRDSTDSDIGSSEEEQQAVASTDARHVSPSGRIRAIHTRSLVNGADAILVTKGTAANNTRDELRKCRERLQELEKERDSLALAIQDALSNSYVPLADRLRSQHERCLQELALERGIEESIKKKLDGVLLEQAEAELQQGKLRVVAEQLKVDEKAIEEQKARELKKRQQKEGQVARAADAQQQRSLRQHQALLDEQKARHEHNVSEAVRAKEAASKYLKETMTKIRRQDSSEAEKYSAEIEQRINAVLSLKSSITTSKNNIDALRNRNKALSIKAAEKEDELREDITAQGGNAQTVLLVNQRLSMLEKAKEEHERKVREGEIQIANRLLSEEAQFARRKELYPHLWAEKDWEQSLHVKPHKRRKLQALQIDLESGETNEQQEAGDRSRNGLPATELYSRGMYDSSDDDEKQASSSIDSSALRGSDEDLTSLAKPEFDGMWNKFERYVVPSDEKVDVIKNSNVSKMEQDIMREKLIRQRNNIVHRQVAAGKEFKGQASFNSKPEVIHFKDFDIGETYEKRIVLTNVSYSINFCKLIGVSEHLKDFVSLKFDPPGQLSAGMTCSLEVTFKPMINEDLEGEISFLSQIGPFSVPIKCTTKKCALQVDAHQINFGTTVIGETLRRHVTLTNKGALGTSFKFSKFTGKEIRMLATAESAAIKSLDAPADQDQGSSRRQARIGSPENQPILENGFINATDASSRLESGSAGGIGQSQTDEFFDFDGMTIGENLPVEIRPFSSVKLELLWKPTIPGKCDAHFIFTFDDPLSDQIHVTTTGTAIDVPVYVERQNIDLKMCTYDRLFQDTIVVKNRATTALKLTFEVPKELRNHMELLPKTGFVQAQSSFTAQLKFLPRSSLGVDALQFFDKETGVMEAPLLIRVADQTRPVPFVVHAVVTSSDLRFEETEVDFGFCTVFETVRKTIKFTNMSFLPQQFGFIGLPEYADVQPGDGFGTVLPMETVSLDILFSPTKAKDYSFELTCKSLINRQFKIQCCGVGVLPPLELSHQRVHFKKTALNDWCTETIFVINSHTSDNEFTHPVPRIGRGAIAPVGPTSFEFVVPDGCPLTLYPSVGCVEPGKRARVQVRLGPHLQERDVRREAVAVATKKLEERAQREYAERLQREREEEQSAQVLASMSGPNASKKQQPIKQKAIGKPSPKARQPPAADTGPEKIVPPTEESVKLESDEYAAAQSSLLRQYPGSFASYTIPCYVASGRCSRPGELQYSVHNTLYLEVHCPIVKPEVVVISDNGRTTINYGDISITQQMIKSITIQNISDETVPCWASLLDTTGPFEIRNALRELPPGSSYTIVLSFAPMENKIFHETLHIYSPGSTLHLNLVGRGVSPTIELSLEEKLLDLGAVLVNEFVDRTFKIKNTSTLSVDYRIKFDSLSQLRHKRMQELPAFVSKDAKRKHFVGVQNFNGKCAFDCVPHAGRIAGGCVQEITLTFAPDHMSDNYSDGLHIELFNMEEAYSFQVIGQCKEHIMYVTGGETLKPEVESLVPVPSVEPDEDVRPFAGHILLMFYSMVRDGQFVPSTADIAIGCVRTMAVSQKKNGEYSFENANLIASKGFAITEPKGYLEAGTKKKITITWTPPDNYNPNDAAEAKITVVVKGDVSENYQILLRGLIVSTAPPVEQNGTT